MTTTKQGLKLEPIEVPDVEGWTPLAFERLELPTKGTGAFTAHTHWPLEGPYLFVFDEPSFLDIVDLQIGSHSLVASPGFMPVETLLKNADGQTLGDRFFPVAGPPMVPGVMCRVTVQNRGPKRSVGLTVYAAKQTEQRPARRRGGSESGSLAGGGES